MTRAEKDRPRHQGGTGGAPTLRRRASSTLHPVGYRILRSDGRLLSVCHGIGFMNSCLSLAPGATGCRLYSNPAQQETSAASQVDMVAFSLIALILFDHVSARCLLVTAICLSMS